MSYWASLALVIGAPVAVATFGSLLSRLERWVERGSWVAGREVRRELDGVDEHGMFSPHEFMSLTDEVYREIDAVRVRREEAELARVVEAERAQKRRAQAEALLARFAGELEECRVSWRSSLEGYRAELVKVVAEAEEPGVLPSKAFYVDFVAARVRGYERALEEVTDEAVYRFCERERGYLEHPSMAATVLKDRIVDRLTSGPYRLVAAAWDREREAREQLERDELKASVRAGDGSRPFVRVPGPGEVWDWVDGEMVVVPSDPKTLLGKHAARQAELSGFGVVSGRARLQREVTQRDLEDNGRLDGSVGQSPAS